MAVHQGFKNFTFLIYCVWERKPSVCVELKLSSRISALKKKKSQVGSLISKAMYWTHLPSK